MPRMRGGVAGDERTQIRVVDPVEQAGAKYAGAKAPLAGDYQHAARTAGGLAQQELDKLSVGGVLGMTMEIEARVDVAGLMRAALSATVPHNLGRTARKREVRT